jgi:hypothetical protein
VLPELRDAASLHLWGWPVEVRHAIAQRSETLGSLDFMTQRQFFEAITSPYWWIAVGLTAILFNIISAYLYRRLDRVTGGISSKRRARKERTERYRADLFNRLREDPHGQVLASFRVVALQLRALLLLVLGLTLLLITRPPQDPSSPLHIASLESMRPYVQVTAMAVTVLAVILSFMLYSESMRLSDLLRRVTAKYSPDPPPSD